MAKRLVSFASGQSETDDVVRRWLARQGIDQNCVMGYSINRRGNDIPTIELIMYFDDAPDPQKED